MLAPVRARALNPLIAYEESAGWESRPSALPRCMTFAIDVLGLRVAGETATISSNWRWPTAQDWSCSETPLPRTAHGSSRSNPVIAGFLVQTFGLRETSLLGRRGVELLGNLRVLPDGYAWQHFRAPDGRVYELTADRTAV